MFWWSVLFGLALGSSLVSLWAGVHTYRDLRTGRPSYESLADYTGVRDRQTLARWYGPPDSADRYDVIGKQIQVRWWVWWLDAIYLDVAFLVVSIVAVGVALWHFDLSFWILAGTVAAELLRWIAMTIITLNTYDWSSSVDGSSGNSGS